MQYLSIFKLAECCWNWVLCLLIGMCLLPTMRWVLIFFVLRVYAIASIISQECALFFAPLLLIFLFVFHVTGEKTARKMWHAYSDRQRSLWVAM